MCSMFAAYMYYPVQLTVIAAQQFMMLCVREESSSSLSLSIERSWAAVVCEGNVGLCPTRSAMHLFGSLLCHGIVSTFLLNVKLYQMPLSRMQATQ